MRVNLSVAIVAMVKTEVDYGNTTSNKSDEVCPLPDDYDPVASANEVTLIMDGTYTSKNT